MTWVRTDDRKPWNTKVKKLSDAAYRLDDHALHHCALHESDGFIWLISLDEIVAGVKGKRRGEYIAELIASGLWHDKGETCASEYCPAFYEAVPDGAWVKHDYWEYNPPHSELEEKRVKRAEAGRLGGLRSGKTRLRKAVETRSKNEANASLSKRSKTEFASEPRPVPSRPVVALATHEEASIPRDLYPEEELCLWFEEFVGRQLSAIEIAEAADWIREFQYMDLERYRARIEGTAKAREAEEKPAHRTLMDYRHSVQLENTHRANSGLQKIGYQATGRNARMVTA